jgi:hypothetical protein
MECEGSRLETVTVLRERGGEMTAVIIGKWQFLKEVAMRSVPRYSECDSEDPI